MFYCNIIWCCWRSGIRYFIFLRDLLRLPLCFVEPVSHARVLAGWLFTALLVIVRTKPSFEGYSAPIVQMLDHNHVSLKAMHTNVLAIKQSFLVFDFCELSFWNNWICTHTLLMVAYSCKAGCSQVHATNHMHSLPCILVFTISPSGIGNLNVAAGFAPYLRPFDAPSRSFN